MFNQAVFNKVMFNKAIVGFALIFLALQSSYADNISIIKTSILEYNQTTTIGKAFDNWSDCEHHKWQSLQRKNGVQMVRYFCVSSSAHTVRDYIMEHETPNIENIQAYQLKNIVYVFDWTMNIDSELQIDGFQLKDVKAVYIWDDGTRRVKNLATDVLDSVYNDKAIFSLTNNELENIGIGFYIAMGYSFGFKNE